MNTASQTEAIHPSSLRVLQVLTAISLLSLGSCVSGSSTGAAGNLEGRPASGGLTSNASGSREQTADQQVLHVLNRLAFGPRPGDVAAVRSMGVDKWIDQQLHPERIRDKAMDEFLEGYATLGLSSSRLFADYPPVVQVRAQLMRRGDSISAADSARLKEVAQRSNLILDDLTSSRVARAVASNRQLEEVMVDFWENHFTVFSGKDRVRYYLPEYDAKVIRPHALGRFRDLLGAVAHSGAMLYYLDNWQSVADSGQPVLNATRNARGRIAAGTRARPGRGNVTAPPGQRRLPAVEQPAQANRRRRGLNENYARELMELHTLGVDGGYTQQDVIEVARALTGWTLEGGAQGGGFLFRPELHDAGAKVILGRKFPAGRGLEEGEEVLDLLAKHPRTARFISTKLVRRFVSDTPPAALVERAAATYLSTDGDIRSVVRTIVTSPEFFSAQAFRAKVKSPFELVTSTLRAMNALPDSTARTARVISKLGQPIFGHQAPDGYPETGDAWMNTGAILSRINFGLSAADGRLPGVKVASWPPFNSLKSLPRSEQVDGVIRELLGGMASPDTRQILVSGSNPLVAQRSNSGLPQILGLALGAPEFQRR